MNNGIYFDDVEVGQEWESTGRTITEADITNFAGLSGDYTPIHTDHHYAQQTPYGRPIAHGLLVWSISTGLSTAIIPIRTLAFLGIKEWQFLKPVYPGDTIYVRAKITDIEERARGRRAVITWRRQIFNQDGDVVQEGTMQTLVEGRANIRRRKETPVAVASS